MISALKQNVYTQGHKSLKISLNLFSHVNLSWTNHGFLDILREKINKNKNIICYTNKANMYYEFIISLIDIERGCVDAEKTEAKP